MTRAYLLFLGAAAAQKVFEKIAWQAASFVLYYSKMNEEQKREEQRKVENRVRRWNESVQHVRNLQREWQRENEEKFGPFLQKF